ncbi:HsdM family class I SAM-dependent methyltransferase [Moritella viscosa]|uniref:class I SAM-dependent DNA methyltransferase n=1 Tax=Moritella viscosa TaxID=80854 RepID=UPI000913E895|nr:class I SAM-dependent DNA methyltransferase [Moritella viscosa]SHO14525.1 Putative uncharacterized protein [Moritella viscosa]SHO15630.1 Putative uncharacterized protein [Moritella viscosa]SHO19069.1 Putative uncharacterized protein [Moritella viscosa]
MVEQDFQIKTQQLIDDLKATCARNGLGNDASEFKIITQVFLYKLLNDKFTFEIKQIEPKLADGESWEQAFNDLTDDEREMLVMQLPADAAELKPEHFISTLFAKQNEADFAKLFDDTLRDIASLNSETFSVMTDSGEKVALFESISEYVTVNKRDDFCRAIINSIAEFSFERIFTQKYDFYAVIFEYLIKDYNSNSGGKYAEYYTPHAVARIMANILVPKDQQGKVSNVSCYDPSAGSGTLLMNVAHAIGEDRCSIFTQDISKKSSNLLRLNLILNNLVHSIPNVIEGDTMRHPHHKNGAELKKFDYIVSNPPFKLDFSEIHKELEGKEHQQRFFAGVPKVPAKAKDKMAIYLLFLQHIISSLKPGGKAAIVVPTGFITSQKSIEKAIRKKIVDEKMLAGVVSMPSDIFATTGTKVSILFLDRKNEENVILIDASSLGINVNSGQNQKTLLSDAEEQQIIDIFTTKLIKDNFSTVVRYDEFESKNYSFSASHYVDVKIEHAPITHEEYTQKMKGFNDNLTRIFDDSKLLESSIKEQLAGLKYE